MERDTCSVTCLYCENPASMRNIYVTDNLGTLAVVCPSCARERSLVSFRRHNFKGWLDTIGKALGL